MTTHKKDLSSVYVVIFTSAVFNMQNSCLIFLCDAFLDRGFFCAMPFSIDDFFVRCLFGSTTFLGDTFFDRRLFWAMPFSIDNFFGRCLFRSTTFLDDAFFD